MKGKQARPTFPHLRADKDVSIPAVTRGNTEAHLLLAIYTSPLWFQVTAFRVSTTEKKSPVLNESSNLNCLCTGGTSITMMPLHHLNPATARYDRNRQLINQQRPKVTQSTIGAVQARSQREEDIFA